MSEHHSVSMIFFWNLVMSNVYHYNQSIRKPQWKNKKIKKNRILKFANRIYLPAEYKQSIRREQTFSNSQWRLQITSASRCFGCSSKHKNFHIKNQNHNTWHYDRRQRKKETVWFTCQSIPYTVTCLLFLKLVYCIFFFTNRKRVEKTCCFSCFNLYL